MSGTVGYARTPFSSGELPQLQLNISEHLWDSSRGSYSDPEDDFKSKLTSNTGVVTLEDGGFPNKINYRVTHDGLTVFLAPLTFNNNLNIKLRSLKINLPDQIRPNCFTIAPIRLRSEEALIIDAITQTGVLITVIIHLYDFIENSKSTIASSNYPEWCKFSQPYGFDIRLPHMLHSFAYDYLVVFLKDGGVIALDRDQKFNIEPVIFNDNSYLESLGKILKPWSTKGSLHGEEGISLKTVVDVCKFHDHLFTITVNRKLRVWSVSQKTLILEKDLIDFATSVSLSSSKELLDSTPSKMLGLHSASNENYLTVFLPFNQGIFKIFKLQNDPFDIIDLGPKFEFPVSLPSSNAIWLISDFRLINLNPRCLQLWALWKSNTSSFVKVLNIEEDLVGEWISVNDSTPPVKRYRGETWSEFYNRKIFQLGAYPKEVLATALPIFEKHFIDSDYENNQGAVLGELSLLDRVSRSISYSIKIDQNYNSTIEKQWKRFDSLCREFNKLLNEPFRFYYDESDGVLLVINKQNYSYLRELSASEHLYFNKSSKIADERLRFLNVVHKFRDSLSSDVVDEVLFEFSGSNFINNLLSTKSEALSKIYEKHLSRSINPANLSALMQELSTFNNLFQTMQELIKLQTTFDEQEIIAKSKLTTLALSVVIATTKEIIEVNREIVIEFLILLLVLEFDNKTLLDDAVGQLLSILKIYEVFRQSLEINFDSKSKLLIDEAAPDSNSSLFASTIKEEFPNGFQISHNSIGNFVTSQILPFISSNEFLYRISIQLIKTKSEQQLSKYFLEFFDSNAIFQLLKAITYMKLNEDRASSKVFLQHANKICKYKLSPKEAAIFQPIEEYTTFFHCHLSKYYLNLAILFLNENKFDHALEFINMSITSSLDNEFDQKYHEKKYETLFTIAIENENIHLATSALYHIRNPKLKRESLERLLFIMYKNQDIKKLVEFKLTDEDIDILDEIILNKAQNKTLNKSLWFYKLLYSFRLQMDDFRGAMEALFEPIQKNKTRVEDYPGLKETISDLYTVVLNLMGTLSDDDQWLIKHDEVCGDEVIGLEDLKEEIDAFKKT